MNITFGISQKYHSHEVFGKIKRRGRATNGAMSLRFVITKKCDARHRIPLVRMTGLVAREKSVIAIVAQYAPISSTLNKRCCRTTVHCMGHCVSCLFAMSAAHDFRKCYALAPLFACGQLHKYRLQTLFADNCKLSQVRQRTKK